MTKAGAPDAWASVLAESASTEQLKLLVEQRQCFH